MSQPDWSSPLVSVGIPTFNRAVGLQRAVESVLAQDYLNVEVVISDNASSDSTFSLCEELCRRDSRIRYIRQHTNIGLVANYAEVFKQSQGQFYMALADDDWLDKTYVSHCVDALMDQPDLVGVCGIARMYSAQTFLRDGWVINLLHPTGRQRVLKYFENVRENAIFHSVIRRDVLNMVPAMQNIMAGDWLYMASIAFHGKLLTLDSAVVYKLVGGNSRSWKQNAQTMGLPWFHAKFGYLVVIWSTFRDIAWASPAYASAGCFARFSLASQVAWVLSIKFRRWAAGQWIIARLLHQVVTSLFQRQWFRRTRQLETPGRRQNHRKLRRALLGPR